LRDANGVSIYFPCFHPSPKYAELQFAEKSKWGEFISALSGLFSEKSSFSEARPDTAGVPLVAVGGRVKADLGTREKIDQGMQQKLPHPPPRKGPKHPTITPAETVNEEIGTRSRKQEVAKK
jgi:hypothetical protein